MKHYLSATILFFAFACSQQAAAQFDFGGIIKGEGKRFIRDLERKVVDQIREEVGPIRRPPVQVLPYPPIEIVQPVHEHPIVVQPVKKKPAPSTPQPKKEAAKAVKLPGFEAGGIVTIDGKGFGDKPGAVFLKVDSLILSTELVDWSDSSAEAKLPSLPIVESAKATLFVMRADEEIAEQLDIELTPASEESTETPIETTPEIHSGQEVSLEGELGQKAGKVELKIGALRLQAKIVEWKTTETTVKIPTLQVDEAHEGVLSVFRANGDLVEELDVLFSHLPNGQAPDSEATK